MATLSPLVRRICAALLMATLAAGCQSADPGRPDPAGQPTPAGGSPVAPTRAALPTVTPVVGVPAGGVLSITQTPPATEATGATEAPAPTATAASQPPAASAPPAGPAIGDAVLPAIATPTAFIPNRSIDADSASAIEPLRTIGYGRVNDAAAAPEAGLLALGTEAGIAFFDLASLKPLRFQPLLGGVSDLDLSPAGSKLAVVAGPRTLILGLPAVQTAATVAGRAPRFSPDGQYLTTQDGESRYKHADLARNRTTIWRAADGASLVTVPGYAAVFSPDGASLATTDGESIMLHRVPDGALIARHPVAAQSRLSHYDDQHNYVKDLAFVDGGTLMVAIGGEVQAWDLAAGTFAASEVSSGDEYNLDARADFLAPGGAVAGVALSVPEGPAPARLIALADGSEIFRPESGHWDSQIAFSPDGSIAVQWSPGYGETLQVIGLVGEAAGEVRGTIAIPAFSALEISPDGNLLAAAGQSNTYLWDFTDPAAQREIANELPGKLRFSPDSRTLHSTGTDQRVMYGDPPLYLNSWNLAGGSAVASARTLKPLNWLDLSPTGRLVIHPFYNGGADISRSPAVIDGDGGEVGLPFASEDPPVAAFSQDGALVALGSESGSVGVFDAADGEQIGAMALDGEVRAVTLSPDGTYVAARSASGVIAAGPVGAEPVFFQAVAPPQNPYGADNQLLISADNQLLIVAGERSLEIRRLSDGLLLHSFDVIVEDVALGPFRRLLTVLSGGQIQVWGIKQ